MLQTLEHRDEMRENARQTALAYSIDRCTERLETVYSDLAG